MLDYRLYFIGDDGHFVGFSEMECSDDDDALAKAEQYADGRDMELWQRARFVKKIPKLK